MITQSLPTISPAEPPAEFLVMVGRSAEVGEQLLAAVPRAKREAAHVVVALTLPRRGFTTDAAVARRVAVREHEEVLEVERMVRHSCVGTGVTAEVVVVRYLSSRFASRRRRRSTAALERLARRRGGVVLNDHGQRHLAQVLAGEFVPEPGAYVAVVLPDSAEAVHVAQAAAELAQASGQPLVLVVPLAHAGTMTDRIEHEDQDAVAIAGRVQPTLDRFALTAPTLPALILRRWNPNGTAAVDGGFRGSSMPRHRRADRDRLGSLPGVLPPDNPGGARAPCTQQVLVTADDA